MDGIFLVDKPSGLTSHDVVFKIKKQFKLNKVGHTGTLDPFATGLLMILVGKATKLAFLFDALDKRYTGQIILGKAYDTDDVTGKVIDELPVDYTKDMLAHAISTFKPNYMQMPPNYSAIKQDGIKAYDAARMGKALTLRPRYVEIYTFDYQAHTETIDFDTHVSKGTYIRSVARDIGQQLNTYGALQTLRRIAIGPYKIDDAKPLSDITSNDFIDHRLLFQNIQTLKLNDYLIKLVKNGVKLDERQITTDKPFVVVDKHDEMIAYYEPVHHEYRVKYFF